MKYFIILTLLFISLSCDKRPKCTTAGNVRCRNNILQVCSGDELWTDNLDCSKLHKNMVCDEKNNKCTLKGKKK